LASICSRVSGLRVTLRPVGSPISEVKSPTRKMTCVAELLKVAQLAHQHGVAQVQVRRGGVEAGLHAQRAAGLAAVFKALAQVADADDLRGALFEQVHLFVYR
jgi:hypothetical protein